MNAKPPTRSERVALLSRLFFDRTAAMFGDSDVAQLKMFGAAEWRQKCEDSGEGAALTVFIGDSRWCDALNGYGAEEEEIRANKALDAISAKLGFDWDMGCEDLLHFWVKG